MIAPTRSLRAALKSLLEDLGLGIRIYDHFPPGGVAPPCIVIQNIAGIGSELGLGEALSGSERGHGLRLLFQIDVYARDDGQRDEITDKVLVGLRAKRAELKAQGIEVLPPTRAQDIAEEEPGVRVWRKSLDFPLLCELAVTP